jgi:AcrR family transcriptional regulator
MGPAQRLEPRAGARGQDRGVARRQAFLQAAREVFLEQGYEVASVNDVVRRAGGSLATLYAQFGNKEGLFFAVVQDQHERFTSEIKPECVDHLPLEEGLTAIGEHYLRALLTRDNLAFYRIIVTEGRKFPELVKRQLTVSADKTPEVVANYLETRRKTDRFAIEVPHAGAYFNGLIRARVHFFALSDPDYRLSETELKEHVRGAVKVFLSGAISR